MSATLPSAVDAIAAALGADEVIADPEALLESDRYAFDDHAYGRFNERIEDALDPNGILSPGKSGIRPARMREDAGRR